MDSGMGVVSLGKHVPLVTEKPCLASASHTHFDHIGCHHEFEESLVHRGHFSSYDGARHRAMIRAWQDEKEKNA